jgi:hypothetical protein
VDVQSFFNRCDDIAIRSHKEQNTTILKRVLQLIRSQNLEIPGGSRKQRQKSKKCEIIGNEKYNMAKKHVFEPLCSITKYPLGSKKME